MDSSNSQTVRMLHSFSGANLPELSTLQAAAVDRRAFLKISVASGFALGTYAGLSSVAQGQTSAATGLKSNQQPNAFLHISEDGTITVQVNRLDFGQGVSTGLPMMLAEELDAEWSKVKSQLAPAAEAYKDPNFGIQMTGGSSAIANSWMQYRELGARARAMLISAAAQQWKVNPATLRTENSRVFMIANKGKTASYGELAKLAASLPVPEKVQLKDPKNFTLIGKPVSSLSASAKSKGTQEFGIDVKLPGMKVAVVTRGPVFGAKMKSMDTTAAEKMPGVFAIFPTPLDRGAVGVAVVADTYWQAKQARDALKIEWNTDGLEKVDSVKQLASYKALAATPGTKTTRQADLSAMKEAAKTITAEYTFPYLAHAPMEPLNATLNFTGDGCEVWVGSQFQTIDQATVTKVLDLKPEQVKLNTVAAGGGFGRRAVPSADYIFEAAQIAKGLKAAGKSVPVKVMWSREDDIKGGYYRPAHVHRAQIALDKNNKVLGWKHTIVGQSIITGTPFEAFMVKNGVDHTAIEGVADTPYKLPLSVDVHHPKVNVPVLWWRSVGHTHTAFVMETLIDELATATGEDPVAYRKRMLDPDQAKNHARYIAALDLAVEKSGYGKKVLPVGRAYGVAVHASFNSVIAYVVEASVKDGTPVLHNVTAGVHCNFCVNPRAVEAQVQGAAAMAIGLTLPGAAITFKEGVVEQSQLSDYQIARMSDVPTIAVHIVPSLDAPTGMGEPGLPPLAPAFANAIAKVTGKRLRSLPFDLQILKA
jgi:isoquinoline 1-oxidoreductase beta subunit